MRFKEGSHAAQRRAALAQLIDEKLGAVRKAMEVGEGEGAGIVVYLHDKEEAGGPTRTRAYASWADDGEVSAHFLVAPDFDDRTELLRSLVANELVKATTFALLRTSPTDHIVAPSSALGWLMEGSGTLLHTGGWFGRDFDALMLAFVEGGVDYPIRSILTTDYQKAWKFNRRTTHTFNVVEFPELASFTGYLWRVHGPKTYTALLRRVRDAGDPGAIAAFAEVYGAPLDELEKRWRKALDPKKRDPSIDAKRFARVLKRYVAILEVSARNLTLAEFTMGPWNEKYAADVSVMPLLRMDLDAAEKAYARAHDGLREDLRVAARAVETDNGLTIELPIRKTKTGDELVPGASVVKTVTKGGASEKRGLRTGDEIHLLDAALLPPPSTYPSYGGALFVTRESDEAFVFLPPVPIH